MAEINVSVELRADGVPANSMAYALQSASKGEFGCTFKFSAALSGSVCYGWCICPASTQLGS